MSEAKILIVEDEPKIRELLNDYLTQSGYQVEMLDEGLAAIDKIKNYQPDCVILDLMLPGKNGLEICKELRMFSMVPVVMVTARVDEIDRLVGLELGADDYICKPFSPREVVMRVRNILRRVELTKEVSTERTQDDKQIEITYSHLFLNLERFQCSLKGQDVALTAVEFRMIYAMALKPGCIFTREQLMDVAYTDTRVVSDRTIDTHIKNLRKKIANASEDELIYSIYGVGYKLE